MKREDEIVSGLIRRARRMALVYRIVQVVFLMSGAVFGLSAAYAFVVASIHQQLVSPFIAIAGPLAACLFWLTYFAMTWFTGWANTDMAKRLQRVKDTLDGLKKLREEYPELLLLNEVTELLEDEKAQIANRRSFWVNIAISLFFTLFGFALSYTAAKLGWLR